MVDRSTSISPDRIFDSPTKTQLCRFHIREKAIMRRKLAVAIYNKKKLQKKLYSLKYLLKELCKEFMYRTL